MRRSLILKKETAVARLVSLYIVSSTISFVEEPKERRERAESEEGTATEESKRHGSSVPKLQTRT
jgi:hypothetical protein